MAPEPKRLVFLGLVLERSVRTLGHRAPARVPSACDGLSARNQSKERWNDPKKLFFNFLKRQHWKDA